MKTKYSDTLIKLLLYFTLLYYICIENTSLKVYEEKMCKFVIVFSSLPKRGHFVSEFQ